MTNNKTQQNNGELLKNMIHNGSQEQARTECIEAVEQYKDFVQSKRSSDTIMDAFYCFFGQSRWEDNIFEYGYLATQLLQAIAKPEVNNLLQKHVSNNALEGITSMLGEVHLLSSTFEHEALKLEFELIQLTDYTQAEDKTPEQWHKLKARYQRKLKALQVETGEEK